MSVRKAERLINLIVMLLETHRPVTPQEIRETIPGYGQENWGSFQRMFERDKEELREMGIPLEMEAVDAWEQESGYRIPKERYYLPDLELEADEIASLWVAAGLLALPDPGAARSGLLKLAGDLPIELEKSRLSWLTADLGLNEPNLPLAFQAVSEKKRVRFAYKSREGEKPRTVAPYGLVNRRGAWYLVGLDQDADDIRSFRLQRIAGELDFANATSTEGEFEVPEGFRPESALEAPPFVKGEEGVTARVHFEPSVAWRVERESPWVELEWNDDGSADSEILVTDTSGFISWVLWFADAAEVISPPELRAAVRTHLETICA